jgi:uncharacterized membrane protein
MSSLGKGSTDRRAEQLVGRILQIGVLLSALVVSAGGVLYLSRDAGKLAGHHEFLGEPERLCNPLDIVRGAIALRPRAVIQLGVLLLILTPVVRVGFTVLVFLAQRDVKFVVITAFVLAVLLLSLLGAPLLPG